MNEIQLHVAIANVKHDPSGRPTATPRNRRGSPLNRAAAEIHTAEETDEGAQSGTDHIRKYVVAHAKRRLEEGFTDEKSNDGVEDNVVETGTIWRSHGKIALARGRPKRPEPLRR